MKQKHFSILAVSLLIFVGLFTYVSFCSPVQALCAHNANVNDSANNEINQLAPRYYEYSEAAYNEAQKTGNQVVLYFWAPWCTTCSALDIEITKDPQLIPEDVIILRIPYDDSAALKAKYFVVTQHTFVQVDQLGNSLQLWVGGSPEDFRKKL